MGDGHLSPGAGQGGGVGGGGDAVRQGRPGGALQGLPPCITTTGVPAPAMCAPQARRKFARSHISGSQAAPRRMVVPPAWVAAIIRVMVAPTLGRRRAKSTPWSGPAPPQCHGDAHSNSTWAPMAASPARWMSTERGPACSHRAAAGAPRPPGRAAAPDRTPSCAWPRRGSRESPLAGLGRGATNRSLPCRSALAPTDCSSARLGGDIARGGTARRRLGVRHSRVAPAAAVRCFLRRRVVCGR